MIGSVHSSHSNAGREMLDRFVLQNLEKFALVIALICIALIGVLH